MSRSSRRIAARSQIGFTLIELLVVIAIIAILIGLLQVGMALTADQAATLTTLAGAL